MSRKKEPTPPAAPEVERTLDQELELLALNVARAVNTHGTLLHDRIDALKALTTYRAGRQGKGKPDEKPDAGDFRSRLGGLIDGASRIHPDRGE